MSRCMNAANSCFPNSGFEKLRQEHILRHYHLLLFDTSLNGFTVRLISGLVVPFRRMIYWLLLLTTCLIGIQEVLHEILYFTSSLYRINK